MCWVCAVCGVGCVLYVHGKYITAVCVGCVLYVHGRYITAVCVGCVLYVLSTSQLCVLGVCCMCYKCTYFIAAVLQVVHV